MDYQPNTGKQLLRGGARLAINSAPVAVGNVKTGTQNNKKVDYVKVLMSGWFDLQMICFLCLKIQSLARSNLYQIKHIFIFNFLLSKQQYKTKLKRKNELKASWYGHYRVFFSKTKL